MSILSNYQRQEVSYEPRTGNKRCAIVEVEEAVSQKSNMPMLVITVQPSNSKSKVKNYIVKNERFDLNMTRFYDAFPTIPDGSDNYAEWIGAIGAANFGEDERGYLKVKWFINPAQAANLPDFVGDVPKQQFVTPLQGATPVADDGLPF